MLNLALSSGDLQGDMVPTANSPKGLGGVPSVIIKAGHALYSPGGTFRLTFLPAAGLVIQCVDDASLPNWHGGQPINLSNVNWVTLWTGGGTVDQAILELDMQADGNFVAYAGTNAAIFNSQTDQHNLTSGAFLRLQDDGNLVIYMGGSSIWSTGTNARSGGTLVQRA
jgi:hypothetical protein